MGHSAPVPALPVLAYGSTLRAGSRNQRRLAHHDEFSNDLGVPHQHRRGTFARLDGMAGGLYVPRHRNTALEKAV
jgi:hypothetical protein